MLLIRLYSSSSKADRSSITGGVLLVLKPYVFNSGVSSAGCSENAAFHRIFLINFSVCSYIRFVYICFFPCYRMFFSEYPKSFRSMFVFWLPVWQLGLARELDCTVYRSRCVPRCVCQQLSSESAQHCWPLLWSTRSLYRLSCLTGTHKNTKVFTKNNNLICILHERQPLVSWQALKSLPIIRSQRVDMVLCCEMKVAYWGIYYRWTRVQGLLEGQMFWADDDLRYVLMAFGVQGIVFTIWVKFRTGILPCDSKKTLVLNAYLGML